MNTAKTPQAPRQIVVKAAHTDAEVCREAADMLGAAPALEALGLPPLTAGRLALLDLIESPLLGATGPAPTHLDAVRALYVIATGPAAVRPVALALRQAAQLERATALAADSPDLFREWLAALSASGDAWAAFDQAALEWLDRSGIADLSQVLGALEGVFADALRGFSLVPLPEGAPARPFADGSAPSGSPVSTPPAERLEL